MLISGTHEYHVVVIVKYCFKGSALLGTIPSVDAGKLRGNVLYIIRRALHWDVLANPTNEWHARENWRSRKKTQHALLS